ncbi:MAG: 2,3-bisphosphoglycerate-independent phosphoglycerate mutase [Candidatus Bathyarchaeia archaeon]
MRVIMIIGDGMADRPLKELNYKTPLEFVKTKNMDSVAVNGISGLLNAIDYGLALGSDVANLAILGYNPYEVYTGRGALEAIGAGIDLKKGDVAFRCNLVTISENFIIKDERAGRIKDESSILYEELKSLSLSLSNDFGVKVLFKQTQGFKGVLVLSGDNLSTKVFAPPPKVGLNTNRIGPLDSSFEAKKVASLLKEIIKRSYELLKDHPINRKRVKNGKPPANAIIPWGIGSKPKIEKPLSDVYGLKASCIAGTSLIKGICKLWGMKIIEVPGATGDIDTDVFAKAEFALKDIKNSDLVLIHLEGPDEASHDGNLIGKLKIIKRIDAMVGKILKSISFDEVSILILADHSTSIKLKKHIADPTPISIASNKVIKDGVKHYNEKDASKGGLGVIKGKHVIRLILNLIGKPERFGE